MTLLLLGCAAPQWESEVAPLLSEKCVSCHQEGTVAPFPLVDPQTVASLADSIVDSTASRRMPPWALDPDCQPTQDHLWLADEELDLLSAWADAGAVVDPEVPVELPPTPDSVRTDTLLEVEWTPVASPDDYRCFVVDPGFDEDVFLTAYEVEPGPQVHHVILYSLDSEGAEPQADTLADEGDSYSCFGSSLVAESRPLAAWAPGTPPTRFPEGAGQRLLGGRRLVVQVHYYVETPVEESTGLRLEWEDSVDREMFTALLGDLSMELEPGLESATADSTFSLDSYGLPIGVFVQGVFPHMHRRGRSLSLQSDREGQQTCLAEVPRWDFDWQRLYLYEDPVYLYPDEQLRLSCTFDTTGDTEGVSWGDGTDDEMCLVGLMATVSG